MTDRLILTRGSRWAFGAWMLTAPLVAPLAAQDSTPAASPRRPALAHHGDAVPVASLAGQTVAVLPITMVTAEAALKRDTLYAKYRDRDFALAWADSTIGAALAERGPEVQWVLAPELRRIARRSPGMVKDPDTYGQAVVRSPRYKELAEPLRGNLRNLVAVAGGRIAMIPAAVTFDRPADTPKGQAGGPAAVRATLTLVLADVRAGTVRWRATPSGLGATPEAALEAALAAALPLDTPAP